MILKPITLLFVYALYYAIIINSCPSINLYGAQIKFPIQKLTVFRKIKPPARKAYAPEGKSRNYAEMYKWYTAQVIPQIDPREIGSAFHRAGVEIAEKGHFWMETNSGCCLQYIGKI
jgi:hypothetical protein